MSGYGSYNRGGFPGGPGPNFGNFGGAYGAATPAGGQFAPPTGGFPGNFAGYGSGSAGFGAGVQPYAGNGPYGNHSAGGYAGFGNGGTIGYATGLYAGNNGGGIGSNGYTAGLYAGNNGGGSNGSYKSNNSGGGGGANGGGASADRQQRSVFVGNIPYKATENELVQIFSKAGNVIAFRLVSDRDTGRPKGFGFCEYSDSAGASAALQMLNGIELHGRQLRVGSSK